MEDPQGAAAHALQTLKKPDGVVMIVEPFANDNIEDNLNPVGRLFYAASTMVCTSIIKSKWTCVRCTSRRTRYIKSSQGWWV
jgi:hypothetical protein